ncbi:MAG: hypothetical protein JW863_01800 [Chitinispirillaceae bacterium]|nr:hypothetical protein [Chitinispirillaceae bacterium]
MLLSYSSSGSAKTRNLQRPSHNWPARMSSADLRTLEERCTPFLAQRAARRGHITTNTPQAITVPSEDDLLLLAKVWGQLSTGFRELYKMAAQLPDTFSSCTSPGGHFEIFYTTIGDDRVDSTDRYGFGTPDWRSRTHTPNGVPDYVDETAFALDSSWAMEIDRFGFVPPVSVRDDQHPSDRYKVVLEKQNDGYYGLTYLNEQLPEKGYGSTITLRNDWSGSEWHALGYDVNPANGIRVTCAHEFFHAIQYAMSWHVDDDIWLDDFPLSWTEGSAVTMEEMAFDSINDYLQYSTTYFDRPTVSFFDNSTSDVVYTNTLLLLYIYYHSPTDDGIEFIRSMHYANYQKKTPFPENLRESSLKIGRSWANLLHSFHTASFFSGSRADPALFLPDAAFFTLKQPVRTQLPTSVSGTVRLNSVNLLRFIPAELETDTLTLAFNGDPQVTSGYGNNWLATLLIRKNGSDSLVAMAIDESGRGALDVSSWQSLDEATLIITNADPVLNRNYSLQCNIDSTLPADQINLYPNPISLRRHHGTAYVSGNDISEIAVYSLNGSLVWRLPEQTFAASSGRQRFNLICRNRNGTDFAPGIYTVVITRDPLSNVSPSRVRRKLLIAP